MDERGLELELGLKEKDRRWSLVRDKMRQEGLAAIVIYANTRSWVPLRYLASIMPTGMSQQGLLFPSDGEPIFVTGFPRIAFVAQKSSWVSAENVYYSNEWAADLAKHLASLKLADKRVGIDSFATWPVRDFRIFQELCPDVQLVEASTWLSEIRGPKSDEELKWMGEAIRIAELAQRTFLANLTPGLKEEEVVGKVEDVVRANGVDQRLWLMASSAELAYPESPSMKIIRKPGPVAFSSEFVRTGGYAAQAVRTYCWNIPTGEYKRMWELCGELRRIVPQVLRPGRSITELGAKMEDLVDESGFECDYLGHAIGLDFGEQPYINSGPRRPVQRYMEWTVRCNEVYVVHPMIRCKGGTAPMAWVGDMYLVREDRTEWMTPFLPGLPEIITG